jgi:LytTr DNA-binding domain-containing protein
MTTEERSFDWRLPAVWAVLLVVSTVAQTYVYMADETRRGVAMGFDRALVVQGTSHLVIAALLPTLYWLQRRWPASGGLGNILVLGLAVVPFSLAHTAGMGALRLLWFNAIMGEAYKFPLTVDRLAYEFAKDVVSYGMLSVGVVVLGRVFRRAPSPVPAAAPAEPVPAGAIPERFAVRKRGKEIMVEVADIDWIEAAGNYAVLHVGGDTLEIRSSLTKLEGELDPKRFVRVHKSYVVNVVRIAEVTPWISGDWRIRLQDGAEVNLSRRYRQRFEALVPVRS